MWRVDAGAIQANWRAACIVRSLPAREKSMSIARDIAQDKRGEVARRMLWIGFLLGIVSGGCLSAVFLR